MLISRNWLQTFFTDPLPTADALSEALTFHVFEIDRVEQKGNDALLDVKVTPNRGHDCLCYAGIAKEVSAILKLPLKLNPGAGGKIDFSAAGRRGDAAKSSFPPALTQAPSVSVHIETVLCSRYIAGYIKGVKVGPSPTWLQERLESIGQRSVNNVVDATNYVMFTLGQPLHAFDAKKLEQKNGSYAISVRQAKPSETLLALDGKEYTLQESMMVIADAHRDVVIGVAGVKGGMPAGISAETTDILIESANFEGVSVRKTAQALRLRTDASQRFEQQLSPELAAFGMQAVIKLIFEIAGGELVGYTDEYPIKQEQKWVSVTVEKINKVLGMSLTGAEVADVFERLALPYKEQEGVFEVVVPLERLDLEISEDLIEEVGRIIGYDRVMPLQLPPFGKSIEINKNFYWAEKIREFLVSQGFSEVFTSVFVEKGERVVLNKVDGVKPFLRTNLSDELSQALEKNIRNKDLLDLRQVKLFEIGSIWKDGIEEIVYDLAVEKIKKEKTTEEYKHELEEMLKVISSHSDHYENLPTSTTQRYQTYSRFPYIVRDVAFWTPAGTDEKHIEQIIKTQAGDLCVKISLFDKFEKNDKTSLGYRIIFQSFERTLIEAEVNEIMEKVYAKLKTEGFEIR